MGYLDEKIAEMEAYLPPLTRREDFGAFWRATVAHTKALPLNPQIREVDYPSPHVKVYDVAYNGFDDTVIHGWFIAPLFIGDGPLPCLIQYHGFNGSRGTPANLMHWAMLGMCVLAVDCREQGGITGNAAAYGTGMVVNVNSKGVLDKEDYYYRAVYMDCLRAIDFAETCPAVDPGRIVLRGTSQGGALSTAVAALDSRPALCLANVPSNSNIEKRVEGRHGSFASVNEYLRRYPDRVERVYETLSYFDTMNMADRIACPVFASVALADPVCPAKLYYATYNRIAAKKDIVVYPFNEHDGAGEVHIERELRCIAESGILNA